MIDACELEDLWLQIAVLIRAVLRRTTGMGDHWRILALPGYWTGTRSASGVVVKMGAEDSSQLARSCSVLQACYKLSGVSLGTLSTE